MQSSRASVASEPSRTSDRVYRSADRHLDNAARFGHDDAVSTKTFFSPRTAGSAGYVLMVMTLMAVATTDPNHPRLGFFFASLFLCLPTMVPGLPVFYLSVAAV